MKKCISLLALGYIVASNHLIECDIKPENIWIAYEAIEKYGRFT